MTTERSHSLSYGTPITIGMQQSISEKEARINNNLSVVGVLVTEEHETKKAKKRNQNHYSNNGYQTGILSLLLL